MAGSGTWFHVLMGAAFMFVSRRVGLCLYCDECMFKDIRGCRAVLCVSCGPRPTPLDGTGLTLLKNILKVTGGGSYPGSVGGGLLGPVVS